MQKLESYFSFEDERGGILGVTQGQPWKEVNFIDSKKNTVRGMHYHKKTRECFFIIKGEILVTIEDIRSGKKNEFTASEKDIFIVDPFEMHTFKMQEDSKWINMLSEPLEDGEAKDIYRINND